MGKIKTNKSSFSIFGDSVRDTKRTSVPLFAANLYGDGGGKGQAVAQGVGGGVDIFDTAISGFKETSAVKSMSPINAQADTLGNIALGTSRENLLNDWSTTAGMQDHYRAKDFATMNIGQHAIAAFKNSAKGFGQMASVSGGNPYAMAAGAIIGGASSNIGSLRSIGLAKKRAKEATALGIRTNNRLNSTFANAAQQLDTIDSRNYLNNEAVFAANGGNIHIAKSKKGTFTAAATKHNMGVQEFASKVLANKDNYSPTMVKKANFAKNASKWHEDGGYLFDAGGNLMSTHGGDFTNGITYVDEGGTHEENPNNGVPMGVDNNGTPNLVEEGEVVYNDYVFSNRLSPDKEMLKQYNLPSNYENYSFAKIANELSAESKERMNDPISIAGLQESMAKLHDAQENYKLQNGLLSVDQTEPTPEQSKEVTEQGEQVPQEVAPEEVSEEPNTFAAGGDTKNSANTLSEVDKTKFMKSAEQRASLFFVKGSAAWLNRRDKLYNQMVSDTEAVMKKQAGLKSKTVSETPQKTTATPSTKTTVKANPVASTAKQSAVKTSTIPKEYAAKSQYIINNFNTPEVQNWVEKTLIPTVNAVNKGKKQLTKADVTLTLMKKNLNDSNWGSWHNAVMGVKDISKNNGILHKDKAITGVAGLAAVSKPVGLAQPSTTSRVYSSSTNKTNQTNQSPTWMRYAPLVANSLNEALLRKDYSDVDNFLEQTKNVHTVKATPLGDYISPNYVSPWEMSTPIERQMAATRHNIVNNAAGNQATATAGLLAADYDMLSKIGSGYLSGKEYNTSQATNATAFNRDTNKINTAQDLAAQEANMNLNNYYLNRAAQEYSYRNAVDAQYSAAQSAAETNIAEGLGNIGLENYYMNQVRDMYPEYQTQRSGATIYVSRKLGGKIKTKKSR